MPYGTKAIEMRELFKKLKNKSTQPSLLDYVNELTKDSLEKSIKSTAIIFDSSNDPDEMCDPNIITKTKVDMNKLRKMRK